MLQTRIVPSVDVLTADHVLGACRSFSLRTFEDIKTAGGREKQSRTFAIFEGCPRDLGCALLLRGASFQQLEWIRRIPEDLVFLAYDWKLQAALMIDMCHRVPEVHSTTEQHMFLPIKRAETLEFGRCVMRGTQQCVRPV